MNLALHKFVDEVSETLGPSFGDQIDDALHGLVEHPENGIWWTDSFSWIARQHRSLEDRLSAMRVLVAVHKVLSLDKEMTLKRLLKW
jgi:hypothetical protein